MIGWSGVCTRLFDSWRLVAVSMIVLAFVALHAAPALAQDDLERYQEGRDALDEGDYQLAAEKFELAIAANGDEGTAGVGMFRRPYYPHFYLGLARYRMGDCAAAAHAWDESDRQAKIQGDEALYAELVEGRTDCDQRRAAFDDRVEDARTGISEADLAASRALSRRDDLADIWPSDPGLGPRVDEADEMLAQARTRLQAGRDSGDITEPDTAIALAGQAVLIYDEVEATARRLFASRQQAAVQPQQADPEPSTGGGAGDQAARPETREPAVEVTPEPTVPATVEEQPAELPVSPAAAPANTGAGDTAGADTNAPPLRPPALDAAVDAYFKGDYGEAERLLDGVSSSDQRVTLQACLFRAAAGYNLWVLGGELDQSRLADARVDVGVCKTIEQEFAPDPRFFSPRFIELFTGR